VFRLSKAFAENLASQAAFTVFSALVRGGGNDTQAVEALGDALKVRPCIVAEPKMIGLIGFCSRFRRTSIQVARSSTALREATHLLYTPVCAPSCHCSAPKAPWSSTW
jgi:hypothetical protein